MNAAAPNIVIRPMRRKDAEAMARMMSALAIFYGDKSKTTAEHFTRFCLGNKNLSQAWIAFSGKTPTGFIITYDWMNFVRVKPVRTIDLIFVEEAFRSQGMGKALIAAVTKDALKAGVLRIDISAAKHNRSANAYYKKLGFEPRPNKSNRYFIEGKALRKLAKKKP